MLRCNYDPKVINRGFRNAFLQGPAPAPTRNNITLVSTFSPNYDIRHVTKTAQKLLDNSSNERIRNIFNNTKVTLATKQPPNLLRQLTRANFPSSNTNKKPNGLFKCKNPKCEMCQDHIIECTSFFTSNGVEWTIQEHISCKSRNVLYFLKCIGCNYATTKVGKTKNVFNIRINNHRSDCRSGSTSDVFDLHVHTCIKKNKVKSEPYFHVQAFMTVKEEHMLLTYESYLHNKGFDTINQ